jgi:APA family basic amino acid/polyamine antiporter
MIVCVYLLANAAYLYVHPIDRVARSPLIAADTMEALFGRMGVAAVSVVVTLSTMGGLVARRFYGPPRVFFAMAGDGVFFQSVARVASAVSNAARRDRRRDGARPWRSC